MVPIFREKASLFQGLCEVHDLRIILFAEVDVVVDGGVVVVDIVIVVNDAAV